MKKLPLIATAMLLPLLASGQAFAHGGHVEGFGAGFSHPLLGTDHLLAMLAIGLWAAQAGFRRAWALPAGFVAGMAGGMMLGLSGSAVPMVEHGVAGTVVILGLALAFAVPLRAAIALPVAAAMGLLHGMAHGHEIGGAVAMTAAGMLVGTALLHALGLGIGQAARGPAARTLRYGGAGIAAAGAALLVLV